MVKLKSVLTIELINRTSNAEKVLEKWCCTLPHFKVFPSFYSSNIQYVILLLRSLMCMDLNENVILNILPSSLISSSNVQHSSVVVSPIYSIKVPLLHPFPIQCKVRDCKG